MKTPKYTGGRPTIDEQNRKLKAFTECRKQGKNLKESAVIVGMTEKTAGKYERLRLKRLQPNADLITVLEAKAKDKNISAKDLVLLTKEIERLREKQGEKL